MPKAKSIANRKSAKKGKWTEMVIKQVLSKLKVRMETPIRVNPAECPGYSMNCDFQLPHLKTFLEVKSSLRDAGLFKIFTQAKAYKKLFPDFKFIVIVTQQTGDETKRNMIHLLSNPYIDDVLYINKNEMGKSISESKEFLKGITTKYFEELMMKQIKGEAIKIIESKDLDFEDRYVPFLTTPMRMLLEQRGINVEDFQRSGVLQLAV
jgi:hypothetical protein